MKRFFFLLSAVVISLTMAAQMQVWSNGTIIFSHDQTDVDSISFGGPMKVQANYNALSPTSLAGSIYLIYPDHGGKTTMFCYALFFTDDVSGYFGYTTDPQSWDYNTLTPFTYSISNSDITLLMSGRTIHGKVVGKNGLVFTDFVSKNSKTYPMCFTTLNR